MASSLNFNQLDPKYFSMGSALLDQVTNPFFGHITSQRLQPGSADGSAGTVAPASSGILRH